MAKLKTSKSLLKAAKTIESARTGIILSGKIVDGKVELDKSCLDEIAKKYPRASKSFVAVNAPFDPSSAEDLS